MNKRDRKKLQTGLYIGLSIVAGYLISLVIQNKKNCLCASSDSLTYF